MAAVVGTCYALEARLTAVEEDNQYVFGGPSARASVSAGASAGTSAGTSAGASAGTSAGAGGGGTVGLFE